MVSDKTMHKAFIIRKTLCKQNLFREMSYFQYLQKLYFGFNIPHLNISRLFVWRGVQSHPQGQIAKRASVT